MSNLFLSASTGFVDITLYILLCIVYFCDIPKPLSLNLCFMLVKLV